MLQKHILCVAVLASMGLSTASAQFIKHPAAQNAPRKVAKEAVVNSRASGSQEISYCEDYITGIGIRDTTEIGGAIGVSSFHTDALKGAKVTKVEVGLGTLSKSSNDVKLFISTDINATPVYEETFTVGKIGNANTGEGEWREFTLATPYEIQGPFYVGYKVIPTDEDYPIGIDYYNYNEQFAEYTDFIYANFESTPKWYHCAEVAIPCNISIRVIVEGGLIDEAEFSALYLPPFIKNGEANEFEIDVTNRGSNEIKSIDLRIQAADTAPVTKTLNASRAIKPGSTATFKVSDFVYNGSKGVDIPFVATITKVNGVEDKAVSNNTQTATFWWSDKTFPRIMVVEEGTGAWCGFCPQGIVGLEYMKKNYPETFIGIAVHNRDEMVAISYENLVFDGYPSSNINRDYFGVLPTKENLEIVYSYESQFPSFAQVLFKEYAYNSYKSALDVKVEAEFTVGNANAKYRLAFVVLENQVGPYEQSNYYAGGDYGDMGGWESLGSSVTTKFDDVARDIFTLQGIDSSLPTEIEAGGKYTYDYSINLSNVTNLANAEYVVLLIDGADGTIVNASKITAAQVEAGVNNIKVDEDINAPIVYYNLQGVVVSVKNLVPGIYIKRQGQKTGKVVIR